MSRLDCLKQALSTYMNPDMKRRIVPSRLNGVIPDGTTLEDLVEQFVFRADQDQNLKQLCDNIKSDNPNPDLHKELDRCLGLDNPMNPNRPRWYDDRMPMQAPLIDREMLREGLYEMLEANPNNPPVLTVSGAQPGKSYCRCLIQHVAAELNYERPVLIDLLEIDSVDQLARRLVDKLGLSYSELKSRFSTEIREGKYFNDWLSGQSREFGAKKRWLLVFDHLAKPVVPQDVSSAVLDLALKAIKRDFTNVYVVLLDCPDTDILEEEELPFEEEVLPIPKQSISDFLNWVVELRRQGGDADPEPPKEVKDALQLPFPLEKPQLRALRTSIVRWVRKPPQ